MRTGLPAGGVVSIALFLSATVSASPEDETVRVRDAGGLRAALSGARAGQRILLEPGVYAGGIHISGLRGEEGRPVVVASAEEDRPAVIRGGSTGLQLSDPGHVVIEHLVLEGATANGLNIDDGGSFDSPAHHVILRRLLVRDVGPRGNRDGIKLSGVTSFVVERCVVERWGSGGSGIDMVGCHEGRIEACRFRHEEGSGANAVQTKGGSQKIVVRRNRFEHAGSRAVNIGGSTGLAYFRPPLETGATRFEAREIRVEGNVFVGSAAPVAFVGAEKSVVRFNTIYRPGRWALRILQETREPGFAPCRDNEFTDNVIAFHSASWSEGGVNIGSGTAPETFRFARNAWYCLDRPSRSAPRLPAPETDAVIGERPRFRDAEHGDLRLQPTSPIGRKGHEALPGTAIEFEPGLPVGGSG